MASIHSRPDGNWHISFRLGGKQFKPSLRTTTERKAKGMQVLVDETLQLIDTGRIVLPPHATRQEVINFVLSGGKHSAKPKISVAVNLASAVDQYFADYIAGKEASTIAGERIHMDHLLRVLDGRTPLTSINSDTLQKYAAKRRREKGHHGRTLSAETIKKEFRTFAQVWRMARAKGYVTGPSPTRGVKLDLLDEKPPFRTWAEIATIIKRGDLSEEQQREYWDCLFLDEAQVLDFVAYAAKRAEHPFLFAAVAIAAFTGARRSEILRSRVEDWDLDRGLVKIREKKGSRKQRTTFREVNVHPWLKEIISDWFRIHPGGVHTIVVPANLPRSRVKRNEPDALTPSQAQDHFQRLVDGSKWKVLKGWHVLRHSFCSNCARRGIPDAVIDAWMGHRGDEAIKKRYRHLFPSDTESFMATLFRDAGVVVPRLGASAVLRG
jgi:integrase